MGHTGCVAANYKNLFSIPEQKFGLVTLPPPPVAPADDESGSEVADIRRPRRALAGHHGTWKGNSK